MQLSRPLHMTPLGPGLRLIRVDLWSHALITRVKEVCSEFETAQTTKQIAYVCEHELLHRWAIAHTVIGRKNNLWRSVAVVYSQDI